MSVVSENNYLKTSLNYSYYFVGKEEMPIKLKKILKIFSKNINKIETNNEKNKGMKSDLILNVLESDLVLNKFEVELDKKHQISISLDDDGCTRKFKVDALNIKEGIIVEIEAGRAVANYQFLKDIMECSMISSKKNVFINNKPVKFNNELFLVLAVRNLYTTKNKINDKNNNHFDYKTVVKWLNTINVSNLNLNLSGILLIGY